MLLLLVVVIVVVVSIFGADVFDDVCNVIGNTCVVGALVRGHEGGHLLKYIAWWKWWWGAPLDGGGGDWWGW